MGRAAGVLAHVCSRAQCGQPVDAYDLLAELVTCIGKSLLWQPLACKACCPSAALGSFRAGIGARV
jgi:hypothetical protein